MSIAKTLDLRPNRNLLEPDFDGYKLSLNSIPMFKRDLSVSVDRAVPDNEQYSFLHAKLFGLHNHLEGENIEGTDVVYFVDNNFTVNKVTLDPFTNEVSEFLNVWNIPKTRERRHGDFNVTMKLPNDSLAVISDGLGTLHILETGSRSEDLTWNRVFSDFVLPEKNCFVVQDAVAKEIENGCFELHCLLLSIKQNESNEGFSTIIHWVSFRHYKDKLWNESALRELSAKGGVYYCYLERNCQAIYVASDSGFKFKRDSDKPIEELCEEQTKKLYVWSQTKDDILIKFKVPQEFNKTDLVISAKQNEILIRYRDIDVISGTLYQRIDADLTTWTAETSTITSVEVLLCKSESTLMWPEIVPGNKSGEYVVDPALVAEIHDRLAHLCSETESAPQMGPTFNSEQVEECDFEDDKCSVFERLSCETHQASHRANISSHQLLLTAKLYPHLPPALGLRHDVDACLWLPQTEGENFSLKHEGTLLAFGYIQASKQNRKFSVCPPDLSYSVICESSRHIFIYRQQTPVTSELRHRTTGKRIGNVAQQQVISLNNEEVLGIYASPKVLFILTEKSIFALNI